MKRGGGNASMLTSLFLRDEMGHIYGKIGVNSDISSKELLENEPGRSEASKEDLQKDAESYRLFLQDIRKSIGLWLDENLVPICIDGAVKEITGYDKEDFHSMNLKWIELVIPEDRPLVLEHIEWLKSNPDTYAELEYRIQMKDGEVRWLREVTHVLPENQKHQAAFQSFVYDINEQKQAEERMMKIEETQKREIHHRVKNNLQVISSLLDLQAEILTGSNVCDTSKVLKAFKDSQNRVASMALIHEELYRSTSTESLDLDFSSYLKNLATYIFNSYNMNNSISLKLKLDRVNLGMDTAIPLGNIVTELISNALKYAFQSKSKREVSILLCKKENYKHYTENSGNFRTDSQCQGIEDLQFVLVIKDNGIGLPKEIDFKKADSLGLQLVNILVEQIDGCIELKRDNGTEFTIWFKDITSV
ncbi:histidine kinase dimerization/phosphoacceptor domain -containing protein [Methanosarcina hadiensis]|uniref:sensor histidine kinase n=1 Tax=Methanosarcina hadiensis TaxID=3078083 RepID=UPI003977CB26